MGSAGINWYAVAADIVLIIHLGYILFTVGGTVAILAGGVLRWNWVRNRVFRLIHLAAVVVVAIEASLGVLCPLTRWEYALRRRGGQTGADDMSLVARIIQSVVFYDFPDWFFLVLYIVFAAAVASLFLLVPISRRGGRRGSKSNR